MVDVPQPRLADVQAAMAKLRDAQAHVRVAGLAELAGSGRVPAHAVGPVVACLEDPSPQVRTLAAAALGHAGTPAASALVYGLDPRQSSSVRVAAASALSQIGPGAAVAVGELCRCLESPEATLRWHASLALGRIGGPAVPALREMLRSPDAAARSAAIDALAWMGPAVPGAVNEVRRLASPGSPRERLARAAALVRLTGQPAEGMPALLGALGDKDVDTRRTAIQRIGELGRQGREAEASVLRCLADPSAEVRSAAAQALVRIESSSPPAVAALTRLLRDPEAEVRANACLALASLGPTAASALPALQALRQDPEARVVAFATGAIERIEGRGEKQKPA